MIKVLRYRFSVPSIPSVKINPTSTDWIDLSDQNLVVGKNASGKSRIIQFLSAISSILVDSRIGMNLGTREIEFLDSQNNLISYWYQGNYSENSYIEERLTRNGETLMQRLGGSATLFSEVLQKNIEIFPPPDVPVMRVRRDEKEFPYFEELINWASGVYSYRFGHIHAHDRQEPLPSKKRQTKFYGDVYNEALKALEGNAEFLIQEFNSLGYNVKTIEARKEGEEYVLYIKEDNFDFAIEQNSLSQGMYRSLSVLIYLFYIIDSTSTSLILIDDLGEGLDFDRSSILGKIIFKKCKEKGVQLIATTNDFFLMNCVEIENWNILKRTKEGLKSYNYKNSRDRFDKFQFTGLNNFHLFSSDFLD